MKIPDIHIPEPTVARPQPIWWRRIRRNTFLSLLVLIAAWPVLSVVIGTSPTGYKYIPGPQDIFGAFKSVAGFWPGGLGAPSTQTGAEATYWGAILGLVYNSFVTSLRAVGGLLLGIGGSITLALLISWSKVARETLSFPAHFARMVPVLGMIPLFALWFGASELGTLVFVSFVLGSFVFVVAMNGIGNVPAYYDQYARSLGASRIRSYLSVVFPAALPRIRGGIVLAVTWSWTSVLAAEFLGKDSGLGHILSFSRFYGATNLTALIGLVVVILASSSYYIANRVLSWLTRWSE